MRPTTLLSFFALLLATTVARAEEPSAQDPVWTLFATDSEASLRGLSALDRDNGWATGAGGTVIATNDGGSTWRSIEVPGAEALDIRDVELFADGSAVLMTAGQPARLYRVKAGESVASLTHESPHPAAFFDALDFWDESRGLVFSDPVDGRFLVLETTDGGASWRELSPDSFPEPIAGEAGFAASGSNVTVYGEGLAWIGTGGAAARVLRSSDSGQSWKVAETPMELEAGTAGIFSIAFRDGVHGLAGGGDYQDPENPVGNLSRTVDGGSTWTTVEVAPPSGHRAAVAHVPGRATETWISVGRAGSDISTDDGLSWRRFSATGFYTLAVGRDGAVWAAGSEGRVARLEWPGDR